MVRSGPCVRMATPCLTCEVPRDKLYSSWLPAATVRDTLLVQPLQRLLLQERIVAKACEPVHRGFAPKPGELALRVAAGGLLNRGARLLHREPVLQDFAQFAITDKVERFRVFGQPGMEQGTNFFDPAICEHGVGSGKDSLVQSFADRGEPNLQRAPTLQWSAATSVQLGERHFGEQAHFDGTNQFLLVRGGDFLRGLGIEARQDPMQVPGTMFLRAVPQPLAKLLGALRDVREALEECAQIQSRANGENREARAVAQIGEDREGHLPIAACRGRVLRAEHINQVMRNPAALGRRRLCRAHVEPAIELRRIARDYFAAELFRQPNSKS